MRTLNCIALLLVGAVPASAQFKGSMICKEDLSMALRSDEEDANVSFKSIAKRTFSLTINREYLSLISAGQSEFYECQKISYRSNKNRALNTIKCQSATNFLTLDLKKMRFIRSQMDPEDETEVGFSYGSCTLL
ncbi:hypothetical protein [Methylobacterium iners]|uniref:Uncharacterized protein n=1 Tax=Methylobacterium iners TaxID=418707 RepID=A0ABQ4RUX9_9HYPH|nr:hypothetical protein [Methylobacterium iners]GJD94524.1 hypothetical protein OCOJLMKI_1727 [Methylobacterium iners]